MRQSTETAVNAHLKTKSGRAAKGSLWQENILGQQTLASGESVKITFDDREKKGKWDLKVVDGKGNSLEWQGS